MSVVKVKNNFSSIYMITLVGKKDSPDFMEWQEQLESMRVSFRMQYGANSSYIEDGQIVIKGRENIQRYLSDLEQDLEHWYYCI